MATAAKKTNGDGLSAAVEASGGAVQTLHDMSMDIEKLIAKVSRLSVGDDPLAVQARARLKQFQSKKDALETDIASMEQKRAELEATSATEMLAGTAPNLKRLTDLAMRKMEAEGELRIVISVIDKAKAQLADVTARVRLKIERQQWKVVAAALNEFDAPLQRLLEKLAVVEKALTIPVALSVAHGLRYPIDDVRKFCKEFSLVKESVIGIIEKLSPHA